MSLLRLIPYSENSAKIIRFCSFWLFFAHLSAHAKKRRADRLGFPTAPPKTCLSFESVLEKTGQGTTEDLLNALLQPFQFIGSFDGNAKSDACLFKVFAFSLANSIVIFSDFPNLVKILLFFIGELGLTN